MVPSQNTAEARELLAAAGHTVSWGRSGSFARHGVATLVAVFHPGRLQVRLTVVDGLIPTSLQLKIRSIQGSES